MYNKLRTEKLRVCGRCKTKIRITTTTTTRLRVETKPNKQQIFDCGFGKF